MRLIERRPHGITGGGFIIMKSKKTLLRNIIILVLSLIFLVGGAGCIYADQLLNKINFVAPSADVSTGETESAEPEPAASGEAKAGLVGGLYHDDAVKNILLLGTDDYQKNDVGRSDSMMLVTIDSRHQKLKTTSFLRDTYLAIPGYKSNKLNAAYSLPGGKEKGARKVVSTIEANFGADIDSFVIVDFSAFPKIIDRLGGVEITLTSGEAKLINAYSGDKKRVKAGVNNLTGLQARYYSRIRAIGDDFERTQRQRKVFASIVSKLKNASLVQINSVLNDTFPLVKTSMTKNEVVSLTAGAMTYLKYPVSQQQMPADGEYTSQVLSVGDVLVPDLDKCRQTLAAYLYENDIPDKTYS
jgi:LCP family protein required for cell wall assembly